MEYLMADLYGVIEEVFIEPIKSVLFIDDQFPTYKCMFDPLFNVDEKIEQYDEDISIFTEEELKSVSKTVVSKWENARIESLTESCRRKGYIFDIENDPTDSSYRFINKADLLVIDFVLERETGSGTKCIDTLKELNNSKHFNLVIVYSANSPSGILAEISDSFNSANMVHTKSESEDLFWIKADNVFLTIVQKPVENIATPENIDSLLTSLINSLVNYNPSRISMMLNKGVNEFIANKERAINSIFKMDTVRYALIYHMINLENTSSDDETHVKASITQLIERTFSEMHKGIYDAVFDLNKKMLEDSITSSEDKKILAKSLENISVSVSDEDLFLALNTFLCSCEFTGHHFTNGTIFANKDKESEVWLCVGPSCDLVPREIRGSESHLSFNHRIYPYKHFEAIRLHIIERTKYNKCLTNATKGEHVYLFNGNYCIYSVNHENKQFPYIDHFLMSDSGRMCDNEAQIYTINYKNNKPRFLKLNVKVVGQLRKEYADRILQNKGYYNSRIGVDFVSKK